MTISLFITLLTIFSTITGVLTEATKKLLDEYKKSYSSNVIAFVCACIVGIGGTAIYYQFNSIPFTINNIICMVLMGITSSIGAMVGYDKIIQTIKQITTNK